MKVYVMVSPSHEVLLREYFLPSVPRDMDVVAQPEAQVCPSGRYNSSHWQDAMYQKVALIQRAVEECWGGVFLHCDVDVQFFAPVSAELEQALQTADVAAQHGNPRARHRRHLCNGFIACRANQAVRDLWKRVVQTMASSRKNDEQALNHLLGQKDCAVTYQILSPAYYSHGGGWSPGQPLQPPADIKVHHANWIVGVATKVEQMRAVRALVLAARGQEAGRIKQEVRRG